MKKDPGERVGFSKLGLVIDTGPAWPEAAQTSAHTVSDRSVFKGIRFKVMVCRLRPAAYETKFQGASNIWLH
jgi:hypothetical protein